jgi:16S rRNA (cytosine1402-N4)-methyltransferase
MSSHTPVLLNEVITNLAPVSGETVVDATVGFGGHSLQLASAIGPMGTLIAFDEDPAALTIAKERLAQASCELIFFNANFRELKKRLEAEGIAKVDIVLFDLGLNSAQLDEPGRGLSFKRDEPLKMTLSVSPGNRLTAADLLNTLDETALADIIYAYGEEKFARRIAREIIETRRARPLASTFDLVGAIERAVPLWYRRRKIHPATKTFQALRIAVGDELEAIKEGLAGAWQVLVPGGRLGVISFHSLEARIAKVFGAELRASGVGQAITKRAIKQTRAEVLANPRSRSAQLRVWQKI